MLKKVRRMASQTDSDPFLRGQDYSDYQLENLLCSYKGDNWYELKYYFGPNYAPTTVPLKIESNDSGLRICYIAPYGVNSENFTYSFPNIQPCGAVCQENAYLFITSFYCNYTYLYAVMTPDLVSKAEDMRQRYCTPNLLSKVKRINDERRYEIGGEGFDLLIDGYDFDILWFNSLNIKELTPSTFSITFDTIAYTKSFIAEVIKDNDEWRINNVITKYY